MGILSSRWDVYTPGWFGSAVLMLFIGAAITLFLSKLFHSKSSRVLFLYVWHTLFCFVYFIYEINTAGDPLMYYGFMGQDKMEELMEGAPYILSFFRVGTAGILVITQWLRDVLGLSFLAVFFVFNLFGALGLISLDACLREITSNSSPRLKKFAALVVLLPSVSFWSSAIGKDSITFMSTGLALWATLDLKHRKLILAVAILFTFFARPHIGVIMVAALGVGLILGSGRLGLLQRTLMVALFVPAILIIMPMGLKTIGMQNATLVDAYDYVESRQIYFKPGYLPENVGGQKSHYNVGEMSPPVRLFTFMFRPLFFDAHNVLAFLTSIENMFLLGLLIYSMRQIFSKRRSGPMYLYIWLFVLVVALTLSSIQGNLGIAARQKWMFMPYLIFLLFAGKAAYQEKLARRFFARAANPKLFSLHKI